MAKRGPKVHHYFVACRLRHSNNFPTDMLRYDQAKVLKVGRIEVANLKGYIIEGKSPPTRGRWESFLYMVCPCNRLEVIPRKGDTNWREAWEVKIGSTWEILIEHEGAVLPEYNPEA